MPQLVSVQIADTTVTLSFSDYLPQELPWPCICSSEKLWWQKSPPASCTCSHHLRFNLSHYGNWYNLAMRRGKVMLVSPPDLMKTEKEHSTQCPSPRELRKYLLLRPEKYLVAWLRCSFLFSILGGKAMKHCPHFRDLPHQRVYELESLCMLHNFSRYLQGATCRNPH